MKNIKKQYGLISFAVLMLIIFGALAYASGNPHNHPLCNEVFKLIKESNHYSDIEGSTLNQYLKQWRESSCEVN